MHASLTLQTNASSGHSAVPASASPAGAAPAPRKSRIGWYLVGGLLLLGGGGSAAYFRSKGATKPVAVTTEPAVVRTITQLVTASGKVQPEVEVKISTEAAGEIIEMPFPEGAKVRKGDLKAMEARHAREQRRLRTDELRSGLATLAARYRDAAAAGGSTEAFVEVAGRVQALCSGLSHNPREQLAVQALFVSLPRVPALAVAS